MHATSNWSFQGSFGEKKANSFQWLPSRHLILAFILCCNSNAFLGVNKKLRSRFPFQMPTLFDQNVIPRSDREMSQDVLEKAKADFAKISSVLLLSQITSAMLPLKAYGAGYQAAPSAFASSDYLYTAPLLPQSALLNSLPIQDELVGELQAYLESFVQLINPSEAQENQIERNDSILWTNLRINAQRAAGMFIYNKNELLPDNNTNFNTETAELQRLRRGLSEEYLVQMQQDVLKLVNGSRKSSVSESLRYMRRSLNALCGVAYMLYPLNRAAVTLPSSQPADLEVEREEERQKKQQDGRRRRSMGNLLESTSDPTDYTDIPYLDGRATVVLTFRKGSEKFSGGSDSAQATIVVDGINHPLTGGNFIDLCLRGVYDNEPVRFEPFEYDHSVVNRTLFGYSKAGFQDEKSGKKREIPLEVLRDARLKNSVRKPKEITDRKVSDVSAKILENTDEKVCIIKSDSNTRFTAVGLARNSPVFTKAAPVLSFATNGALGMMHDIGDENGASQGFFWVQVDRSMSVSERHLSPAISKMNNRFSLFAHVVEGNDVLDLLRPGDIMVSAVVKGEESAGAFRLLKRNDEASEIIPFEEEEEED